jgi:hypothetical protein
MAKVFDEVVGLDFSHAFVAACDKMKANKSACVPLSVQGDIRASVTVSLPADCLPHVSKTRFIQGDACDLPPLGQFDCVLAANLLCRLPNPAAFLTRLPDIITKVGCLCRALLPSVSSSSPRVAFPGRRARASVAVRQALPSVCFCNILRRYSWLEEYTPKANWIGAIVKNGSDVHSADALNAILSDNFDKVYETDMPFLIREHARKFQWGCSHAVVWRRK